MSDPPVPPPPGREQPAAGTPPPPPTGQGERPLVLQPMGIGEILDAAIKLYRSRWKTLIAIVAIPLVPLTTLSVFLTRDLGGPYATEPAPPPTTAEGAFPEIITVLILTVIQLLFVQPFLTAAIARASADVYLGRDVAVGGTFRFAISRVHSILWISILTLLAALIGLVLLVIPMFLVLVRFAFGSAVLVVEGRKGSNALGRSWRLAKGHFWRLFGTFVFALFISGIVSSILSVPGNAAFSAIGPSGWPLAALGDSLAAILTTPFTTLVTVLLYFDLRIRKEAFDLEVMAQELSAAR